MTDFYKAKLYRAERRAFAAQPYLPKRTIAGCVDRIGEIAQLASWRAAVESSTMKAAVPGRKPNVLAGTGRTSWANSGRWEIKVARGHLGNDWVLIHEMAHLPTDNSFQGHGREFCALYLAMVLEAYGQDMADRLRAEMVKEGLPLEYDAKHLRQIRGYLRQIAKPYEEYPAIDRCLVLKDGRTYYAGTIRIDDDTIYLDRAFAGQARGVVGTPESVDVHQIAYVTWAKERRYRY